MRGSSTSRLLWLGVSVAVGLTGCHHRRAQPLVLPPQTPVALIAVPEPTDSQVIEAQAPKLPAVPIAHSTSKPKKPRRRAPKPQPVVSGPAQAPGASTGAATAAKKPADPAPATTNVAESPVVSIGALSVGGEQSPRAMQEAGDLISLNERRLAGLSADMMRSAADLVGKVRNFQKDAQQALTSGDAEGAKTLATKGKLLLDDLDKDNTK